MICTFCTEVASTYSTTHSEPFCPLQNQAKNGPNDNYQYETSFKLTFPTNDLQKLTLLSKSYQIVSNFIPISYNKTNRHEKHNMILRTWSKGHKGLRKILPLTKVSTNLHKNTQDMLQNEVSCIHILKLISADFWSVWLFCNVLKFCLKNSKK